MAKKTILLTISLLCAAAQGAWADTWDGVTYTKPSMGWKDGYIYVFEIQSAAELAYVMSHFSDETGLEDYNPGIYIPEYYYQGRYVLKTDIDMGDAVSWTPIGNHNGSITDFEGIFFGEFHTIRINIHGATDNYQGLFARIGEKGTVQDLRVSGSVECSSSRLVGGIAGENYGKIHNCVVTARVSSDWGTSWSSYDAKVGGIAGENSGTIQYCCVTGNVTNHDSDVGGIVGCNNKSGTVNHVTFHGVRYSRHSQDNVWVGDLSGTLSNQHGDDLRNDDAVESYLSGIDEAYTLYRNAVAGPFAITISSVEGNGTLTSSTTATRGDATVTLTKDHGSTIRIISVKDAYDGSVNLSRNGDEVTFCMPRCDVSVSVTFASTNASENWQDHNAKDFASRDYNNKIITIKTPEQLALMTLYVNEWENDCAGWTFKLEADLNMARYDWTPIGGFRYPTRFRGTFDGQGHTISGIYVPKSDQDYVGLFGAMYGTVKNLKLTNSVIEGRRYVGGIAGSARNTIENCYVGDDVTVIAADFDGIGESGKDCGGITGYLQGQSGGGNVYEAYNAYVKGCYSGATVKGVSRVGGIVGRMGINVKPDMNSERKGYIQYNVSKAKITSTAPTDSTAYILGSMSGGVMECNYYVADKESENVNDKDSRAFHIDLDDELKEMGFSLEFPMSETFETSGLSFDKSSLFKAGDEWYGVNGGRVFPQISAFHDEAQLENLKVNGNEAGKDDEGKCYFYIDNTDVVISGELAVTLYDDSDYDHSEFSKNNIFMLHFNSGRKVNVTLQGRTLYKNDCWNTLCLPFDLTISGSVLDGADVRTLEGCDFDNTTGTLTLTFTDKLSEIKAGMPYIIKWPESNTTINSPMFNGVTVSFDIDDPVKVIGENEDWPATFSGIYTQESFDVNPKILYLGAENKLYYPNATMTIGACRAYFKLKNGLTAGDLTSDGVKAIRLNFGDGATGIMTTDFANSADENDSWFTIDGRQLNGQPAQPGIYIHNGQKVMLK